MKIHSKSTVAHLYGDLNHSGATHNIVNTLAASLQKIESVGDKSLHIDCTKIISADFSGLQLLYVWMQCARHRGVEPRLVNLSNSLQQAMQSMGISHCFSGFNVSLVAA
ncbi:MAG: STAS domain-containing protein [Desulfuromonadaceae bacterium]|nr:STAS domain-containing protein [Desulfuromonadaceae bacterium]